MGDPFAPADVPDDAPDDRPVDADSGAPDADPKDGSTLPEGNCGLHGHVPAVARCHECERAVCADCCHALTIDEPPRPVAVCLACADLYGVPSSVPFENPGGIGGFFRTWGRVLAFPNSLFTAFPRVGALRATVFVWLVLFPVTLALSSCLGLMVMAFAGIGHRPSDDGETAFAIVVAVSVVWGVYALFPAGIFLAALVHHAVVLLAKGRGTFATTYRVICYLFAVRVTAMPVQFFLIGVLEAVESGASLLAWVGVEIWHSCLLYGAVRRVHGLGVGAAVAVSLVPVFVWCLMFGGLFGLTALIWLL